MSILFFILGAIVLAYWGGSMARPFPSRPPIIRRKNGFVFLIGLVLIIIGALI